MSETKDYRFTEGEALQFRNALLELRAKDNEIGAMIRLVVAQQGLAGNWQLKPDGSGLQLAANPLPQSTQ